MTRWMRGATVALLVLFACAKRPMVDANAPENGSDAAAKKGAAAPPREVAPAQLVPGGAPSVSLVANMEVLRAHPDGRGIGSMITAAAPQWRKLVRAIADDPVTDLTWVFVAGPTLDSPRALAVVRYERDDDAVSGALEKLGAAAPEGSAF